MDTQVLQYPIICPDGTKILLCSDCGEEFCFTVQAQDYFRGRGFAEDPKRCKSCYQKYKKKQRFTTLSAPSSIPLR